MDKNSDFKIIKHIVTLPKKDGAWATEINLISWHGKEPVYDIRDWLPNHHEAGEGLMFTADEAKIISAALCEEIQDDKRDDAVHYKRELHYLEEHARELVADYLGLDNPEDAPDDIDYDYLAERFYDEKGGEPDDDYVQQQIIDEYMEEREGA